MKKEEFLKIPGVSEKLKQIADKYGFTVDQLLNTIEKESQFKTTAVNPKSDATGLIQFMPDTAIGLNTSIAQIKEMDALSQLDLIDRYFEKNHTEGQHPYITVAYPKAGNMDLDDVIADKNSAISKQNKPWRNKEGNVTKRSILAYVTGESSDISEEVSSSKNIYNYDFAIRQDVNGINNQLEEIDKQIEYATTTNDGRRIKSLEKQKNILNAAKEFISAREKFNPEYTFDKKIYENSIKNNDTEQLKLWTKDLMEEHENNLKYEIDKAADGTSTKTEKELTEITNEYNEIKNYTVDLYTEENVESMDLTGLFQGLAQQGLASPSDVESFLQDTDSLAILKNQLNLAKEFNKENYTDNQKIIDLAKQNNIGKYDDGKGGGFIHSVWDPVEGKNYVFTNRQWSGLTNTTALKDIFKDIPRNFNLASPESKSFNRKEDPGSITEISKKLKEDIKFQTYFGLNKNASEEQKAIWAKIQNPEYDLSNIEVDLRKILNLTQQSDAVDISQPDIITPTSDVTTSDNTTDGPSTTEEPLTTVQKIQGVGDSLFKGAGALLDTIGGPNAIISYVMGKKGLKEAMKEVKPQASAKLSPMFMEHLRQTKELAKKGFHPDETRKFRKELDKSYQMGLENAVRGSAGNRARFLAQSGVLDAQRSSALLDFSAKDAELQKQNADKYEKMMLFKENFDIQRTEKERAEDLERQVANKKAAAGFTSAAFTNLMTGFGGGSSSIYDKVMNSIIKGTGTTNVYNTIEDL